MSNNDVTDPKENPVSDGHLPVSGEVGGPVAYHDPTTTDTNDDPEHDPTLQRPVNSSGTVDDDDSDRDESEE